MQNMKYLVIAAAITLAAGLVPLLMMISPVGALLAKFAIALSMIGFAVLAIVYFKRETAAALTLRDEDFHWH